MIYISWSSDVKFFHLDQFLSNYWSYSSDTWHLHDIDCGHPCLTLTYISQSTACVKLFVFRSVSQ